MREKYCSCKYKDKDTQGNIAVWETHTDSKTKRERLQFWGTTKRKKCKQRKIEVKVQTDKNTHR